MFLLFGANLLSRQFGLALVTLLQFWEGLTDRQAADGAERRIFDAILTLAQERALFQAGGRQRSESTHVLGAVGAMTRLASVTETLRHALHVLATLQPEWLRAHTSADWVDRYGLRASEYRLPKAQKKRDAWAEQVGRDGQVLLTAVYAEPEDSTLRKEPAIETLRLV